MATTTAVSRRAKFVYIIGWVLISLSLSAVIGAVIYYSVNFSKIVEQVISNDPDSIRQEDAEEVVRIFIILVGVIGGINILYDIWKNTLLTTGVRSRYLKYCKTWFVVDLGVILLIINQIWGYQSLYSRIASGIYVIWRTVTRKCIKDFKAEVREDGQTGRVHSPLN